MPERSELYSIASLDRERPAIDTAYFPNTLWFNFWSASPRVGNSNAVWHVNFGYGNVSWYLKDYALRVQLVRSGQ